MSVSADHLKVTLRSPLARRTAEAVPPPAIRVAPAPPALFVGAFSAVACRAARPDGLVAFLTPQLPCVVRSVPPPIVPGCGMRDLLCTAGTAGRAVRPP